MIFLQQSEHDKSRGTKQDRYQVFFKATAICMVQTHFSRLLCQCGKGTQSDAENYIIKTNIMLKA